jgi:hypothetical protein
MSLKIPTEDYPKIKRLLQLPEPTRKHFLKALQEGPPALSPGRLSVQISKKIGINNVKTFELLSVIIKLFSSFKRTGLEIDEFLDVLGETLTKAEIPELTITADEWNNSQVFIREILECEDSIGVTARALNVMTDHGRVFIDARILTDCRPVFRSDPRKPPAAAVIVHTLKIGYRADHEDKEFFVALDSSDIAQLEALIKRAKMKENALKLSLRPSKMPILES